MERDRDQRDAFCHNNSDEVKRFWETWMAKTSRDDPRHNEYIMKRLEFDLDMLEFYFKNDYIAKECHQMQQLVFKSIENITQIHIQLIEQRADLIERAISIGLNIVEENLNKIFDAVAQSSDGKKIKVNDWTWGQIELSLRSIIENLIKSTMQPLLVAKIDQELQRIIKQVQVNRQRVPERVIAAAARCLGRLFWPTVPSAHMSVQLEDIVSETILPLAVQYSSDLRFISGEFFIYLSMFDEYPGDQPRLPWWPKVITGQMIDGYTNSASRSLREAIVSITKDALSQQRSKPIELKLMSYIEQYDTDPALAEISLDVLWTLQCSYGIINFYEDFVENYLVQMLQQSSKQPALKCRLFEFFRQWINRMPMGEQQGVAFGPVIEEAIQTFLLDPSATSMYALFCLATFANKSEELVIRTVATMQYWPHLISKLLTQVYPTVGILDDFKLFQLIAPATFDGTYPQFLNIQEIQQFLKASLRRLELRPNGGFAHQAELISRIAEFIVLLSGSMQPNDLKQFTYLSDMVLMPIFIERISQILSHRSDDLNSIQTQNFCISLMVCSVDGKIGWQHFERLCSILRDKLQNYRDLDRYNRISCKAAFNAMVVLLEKDSESFFGSPSKITSMHDVCRISVAYNGSTLCPLQLFKIIHSKWPPLTDPTSPQMPY